MLREANRRPYKSRLKDIVGGGGCEKPRVEFDVRRFAFLLPFADPSTVGRYTGNLDIHSLL